MPFRQVDAIKYYQAESLDDNGLVHGFFTRHGGVSEPPHDSLNVGGTVGDDPQHVAFNLDRVFEALGRPRESLFDVWQIHSSRVVVADGPRHDRPLTQADVVITQSSQSTLMMRFADCVPILGYDPVRRIVGIAHAGWKGTLKKAGPAMIAAMQGHFGSNVRDIRVVLGPSIGPDHYEVGREVISGAKKIFNQNASVVLPTKNERIHFDLWTANRLLLEQAGVEQIEVTGICTACHTEDWFSHRANGGRTGRFGALIALRADLDAG